jgi:hypothetical protein
MEGSILTSPAGLGLAPRVQRRLWVLSPALARGRQRPALVFPSSVETPLDPSNARKALARIVEKTELR